MTQKPQIIFHIGTHKTGSTALQEALAANQSTLRRHGLHYLKAGRHLAGHHRLAWAAKGKAGVRRGDDPERILDSAARELERLDGETALVSSEVLENFGPGEVAALQKRLGIDSAHIVVYLRPQHEYLLARYKQKVKRPHSRYTGTFVEYVFRNEQLRKLDYRNIANAWAKSFGDANIVLRVFAPGWLRGDSTISDFLAVLGLDKDPQGLASRYAGHRSNVSPPDLAIEAMRILNRFPLSGLHHRTALRRLTDAAEAYGAEKSLMTAEVRRAIWERYHQANRKLAERFGVDLTPLVTSPSGHRDSSGGDVVEYEEVAAVLAAVVSDVLSNGKGTLRELLRVANRRRLQLSAGSWP